MNLTMFRIIQGWVRIKGATDGTKIGNDGDRLKVTLHASVDIVNTYSAVFTSTVNVAGTHNAVALLRNPSGSGKKLKLVAVFANTPVGNRIFTYRVYCENTIVLPGTAVTPKKRFVGASQPASVMEIYSLPVTITLASTPTHSVDVGQNVNCEELLKGNSIMVNPGTNLVLTANPSSNNTETTLTAVWEEL